MPNATGTAILKIASHRKEAPEQGYWLTLDADGAELPSDWYLRLAGEITRMFHGDIKPENMLLDRDKSIVLSDFGIALMAQSSRYQSTQGCKATRIGLVISMRWV